MEELRVLLTAAGCPGAAPVIRQLKQVEERSVKIIGTDIDQYKIGAHWCDRFHLVPRGTCHRRSENGGSISYLAAVPLAGPAVDCPAPCSRSRATGWVTAATASP